MACQKCADMVAKGMFVKQGTPVLRMITTEFLDKNPFVLKTRDKIRRFQRRGVTYTSVGPDIYRSIPEGHILCDVEFPYKNGKGLAMGSTVCSFIDPTQPYACACDMRIIMRYGCMCGGT